VTSSGAPKGVVLVVDDDENMRALAAWVLDHLGYRAVQADSTKTALGLLRQALDRKERFAAVILDLWMPGGPTGDEALALLRGIDPDLKAFVMSGDGDDPRMRDPAGHGFLGAISKTRLHETLPRALEGLVP
jgi:DNA-binding NtrC family response regulator